MWIFLVLLLTILITVFTIIARKGRALRKSQPLPPKASHAYIQWEEQGQNNRLEVESPFYFGRSEDCDLILPAAKQEFEACIFAHRERFALQTLDGAQIVLVNGQELQAGYLWDGDVLKVADQTFTFRCY